MEKENINNIDFAGAISEFFKGNYEKHYNDIIDFIDSKPYSLPAKIEDVSNIDYNNEKVREVLRRLLEKYYKLDFGSQKILCNSIEILRFSLDNECYDIFSMASKDMILSEYRDGKTFFDYLLDNNMLTSKIIDNMSIYLIPNDINTNYVLDRIFDKDPKLLAYFSSLILFSNYKGVKIIDYLFKNNLILPETIKAAYEPKIYDLCIEYNRLDLLKYLNETILMAITGNHTILEEILDKGIVPELSYMSKEIIIIYAKRGMFEQLLGIMGKDFLIEYEDGKTILEGILERKLTPTCYKIPSEKAVNIIFKYKRYDLINKIDFNFIFNEVYPGKTYLDIYFSDIRSGIGYKLSDIYMYNLSIEDRAKFYIAAAKNGLIEHINALSANDLMRADKNGKLLIDYLLEYNKDLTINTIIRRDIKEDFDIATYLRQKGIEQENIDIETHENVFVEDFFDSIEDSYNSMPVSDEAEALLSEFKIVMLDGKSDPKLVDTLAASYRYILYNNEAFGMKELERVISIKKTYPEFSIKLEKNTGYYNESENAIHVYNRCIDTLNHEMGHAIYHLLGDKDVPDAYIGIINELRNDSNMLNRIRDYSIKYREIREKISRDVDEMLKFYNTNLKDNDKDKISDFLKLSKEDKIKIYKEKGYSDEQLSVLFDDTFSLEEYLKQDKRIKKEELIDVILRTKYGSFFAIGDIIDSIYSGKLHSGELFDRRDDLIMSTGGHGIAYYDRGINWSFDETMANYSAIIKSKDSREILSYLRDLVGEKFLNCISDYYENVLDVSYLKGISIGG